MVSFNRFASITARFSRWAISAMLCMLVLIANIQSAAAFGSNGSKPSDGVVQLDKIEQQAKDVLKKGPREMKEVAARAETGINGVQGGANASKMNSPENSQEATTIKESIKDTIKDLKS